MNRFMVMAVAMGMLAAGGAARAGDTLAEDETAIAKYIHRFHDSSEEVREAAAKELRVIVAKYGNGTSNIREKDTGEARWREKISHVKVGMTSAEVLKFLPVTTIDGSGAGWYRARIYHRIDMHWMVEIFYDHPYENRPPIGTGENKFAGPMLSLAAVVLEPPRLIRSELLVYQIAPPGYTGKWCYWYVNGQKAKEVDYKNGQPVKVTDYCESGEKRH